MDIAIYDSRDESILDGAMALCREYENRFSRTLSGSEVYRLNHREDATGTYPLSDDMTDLLATASITVNVPAGPLISPPSP